MISACGLHERRRQRNLQMHFAWWIGVGGKHDEGALNPLAAFAQQGQLKPEWQRRFRQSHRNPSVSRGRESPVEGRADVINSTPILTTPLHGRDTVPFDFCLR